jgi:reactive intermediate/imine deaminase
VSKKQIHTSKAPPALGPYSQAVQVDNLLFLSGQIPLNYLGELVVGSIKEQAEQVFANIDAIIKKSGGTLDDVIKLSVFVTDMGNFEAINKVMVALFSEPYPVRTTVEVSTLPKNSALEIEALVNIDPDKQD